MDMMGILPIDVILVYSTNYGIVIGKMLTKQWNFRGIWYPIFSRSYLQWRFIGIIYLVYWMYWMCSNLCSCLVYSVCRCIYSDNTPFIGNTESCLRLFGYPQSWARMSPFPTLFGVSCRCNFLSVAYSI